MARETATKERATMGTIGEHGSSSVLDLVPVEERNLRGMQLAEQMFSEEERTQLASMLSVPSNSPALLPYLALCIAEGFSPWANHVWLIPKKVRIPAKDGQEAREEEKHIPAVGRDGLLHKARQTKGLPGGYRGMQFAVVCEHDTFEVEYTGDIATDPKVLHRFATKPTEFAADESPDRYRGRVIGAWAKLFLDGEPPTFYFANLREHGRLQQVWAWNDAAKKRHPLYFDEEGRKTFGEFGPNGQRRPVQEWAGAWDYLSTMILKAAQSYVCRIGLGVTGFVPVDEMRDVKSWQEEASPATVEGAVIEAFDFAALNVPAELRERLQRAVEAANAQEPYSWGPAKCEMVFTGRSADELAGLVEQIEDENDLREQRAAKASGEEPIVEAEVVEDPAADGDRMEELRQKAMDLVARREQAEEGSEEHAVIVAELEGVEAELRQLGGTDPQQPDLGL